MWTHRQARRVKAWSMVALGVLIFALVTPLVLRAYQQRWPDEGTRPLIVIATQGDDHPYTVQVRSEIDAAGRYEFWFALQAPDESASGADRSTVQFQLTLVGRDMAHTVSCGPEADEPSAISPADLDPGTRMAYDADRSSSLFSATGGDVEERELEFATAGGELQTLYADEDVPVSHDASADGTPLAHGCAVDASVIWAAGSGGPMDSVRSTLFAPQFNATTMDGRNIELEGLGVSMWVERATSATIEDSYPSAVADSEGWSLWLDGRWSGASSFLYTEQPTWLFENRDGARFEQAMLLFGGILLGLALSLFQGGIGDLIDAYAREEPRT